MQDKEKGQENRQEKRADGYKNMLNKYGTKDDVSEQYRFESDGPVTDLELTLNYEENGLFAKAIDIPADDAVSSGFSYGINDVNLENFINESLDELNFEEKASTAIKWSRLYGGALMVMIVDDGRGLEEPVDWDNIHGIDELLVFERPLVTPDYNSIYNYKPKDRKWSKFGMPKFYDISPVYGNPFRVHESRCLLFKNGTLPQSSSRAEYRFFGMPEYARIHKALQETATSHGNGVKLLDRAVQSIYKMSGLANLLETEEGEDVVLRRLRIIDMAKGIINSIAIDANGEDYDYKTVTFSGVKDIIDAACNMLSAVTNIPQTKLFGRSPAGENATGRGDMENYYTYVRNIQKLNLKKNLGILIDIILLAGKYKEKFEKVPNYALEFKPLWSLSEAEQAAVEQTKAATELAKAQAAQVYVDMQALDPSEVRKRLAEKGEFMVSDILDGEDDWEETAPAGEKESEETTGTALSAAPKMDQEQENGGKAPDVPTGCGVLVIQDGRILVGDRKDNGLLCGPGGHIEAGETPEEAAVREAREEFGINVAELIPVTAISDMPPDYCPSQVFLCTEFYGTPIAFNDEMENARFESVADIMKQDMYLPFRLSVQKFIEQLDPFRKDEDSTEGKWITTKSGKHIQIGESGELLKGHPAAIGGGKKISEKVKTGEKSEKREKTVDYKAAKEYSKAIKGVVTVKGTEMEGVTAHAAYRMKERGLSTDDVKDALTGAGISYPGNKKNPNAECYQHKGLRMVVSQDGVLISAIVLGGAK